MVAYTVKTIYSTGNTTTFDSAIDTYMDASVTNLDAFQIYLIGHTPVCKIVHH